MNELTLHPNVYSTSRSEGLVNLLEKTWTKESNMGKGTYYILSGFANYNGGVRFYNAFRKHLSLGGKVVAIFSGSANARLTSKQVVQELLDCGCEVIIINRKRLMHAKSYGSSTSEGELLIVTSGNFTAPGMSQNVEMAVFLDHKTTREMNFSWDEMIKGIKSQDWQFYWPNLQDLDSPSWKLLYDEKFIDRAEEDRQQVTMVLTLGAADTARINAERGTNASKGSQYFWLSKECVDFFPPLTIKNIRGIKSTYSCDITIHYIDLNITTQARVTYEAENNVDFRLGTGQLRGTKLAQQGDLAAISRIRDSEYELRIFTSNSKMFASLFSYAITDIGHKGKKFGYISNRDFFSLLNISPPKRNSYISQSKPFS